MMTVLPLLVLRLPGETPAADPGSAERAAKANEATNYMGAWIWETNTFDKQTVWFWKPFEIPAGAKVSCALARITADNGYTLFLDGEEIGRGSEWHNVTEFDVTQLLAPGRHVVIKRVSHSMVRFLIWVVVVESQLG